MDKDYAYTRLWKFRYLTSLIVFAFVLFALIYFVRGRAFFVENIYSYFYILLAGGVFFVYRFFVERKLVVKLVVSGDSITFFKGDGDCIESSFIDIESVDRSKKPINGFGVPELSVNIFNHGCIKIPENIIDYEEIHELIVSFPVKQTVLK